MSTGLLALLDDIVALAKVAAASLDDAAAQATKAGSKAAGIVIDDAAVTPRYVVGFAAERELPIIWKIAKGSLKNKLLFLLPGCLALSLIAPWVITPLLMLGGAYLCIEGYEKVVDTFQPKGLESVDEAIADLNLTPEQIEDERVDSAIRTDFILSAEIMAITLASVASVAFALRVGVLLFVAVAMTVLVYGAVAIIVKMDDWGAALARTGNAVLRTIGRAIVKGMPGFLKGLSFVGMIAMLWVGGGILTHGLHELGWHAPEDLLKAAADAVSHALPIGATGQGIVHWLTDTTLKAAIGLVVGLILAKPFHQALHHWLARKAKKGQGADAAH